MAIYIALLRGINVSGHRLINMNDLKQMFDGLGLGPVQTYIQSGNVLFRSEDAAERLSRRIKQGIEAVFGFDLPVLVRTAAEMAQIVSDCPFRVAELPEGESLYVTLLADTPAQEGLDRLSAFPCGLDEFRLRGRDVYIRYRQSAHKSKLTNNLFEQKLRVPATTRNWQTITRLAEMAKAMES